MAAVASVLTVVFVGTLMWWEYPDPVLTVKSMKMLSTKVVPGEWAIYEMDYCKTRGIEGEVHYSWVDGIAFPMPGNTMRSLRVGCHVTRESIRVPGQLPPGRYRLEVERVYRPSPLRTVEVSSMTQYVDVLEDPWR
jgi:hypothetical protein